MANSHVKAPRSGKSLQNVLLTPVFLLLLALLIYIVYSIAVYSPSEEVLNAPLFTPPVTDANDQASAFANSGLSEFAPAAADSTKPELMIASTQIEVNGQQVESYAAGEPIDFGTSGSYAYLPGIVTFRGNNFRDSASYGTANVVNGTFSDSSWTVATTNLEAPDGEIWTGSGWVGQPLMMTWPKEMRAHMNMFDWAKAADELTEVIYATMDGNIYFLDLATGQKTRECMNLGYTFKGAGALDPRGYPILYLGSGYDSAKGLSHAFIINLYDCSVMYEFGQADSFSLRGTLSYFDGSALVDAETDQLIYPGENGILYIIKLNTSIDPEAGTLSIAPSNIVKWRYSGIRSSSEKYWLGMEDSAVIYRSHIIFADNGGHLMCLDLNTLTLDWVQDVLDDTNCSPVLELEDGHPYVYISTSFRAGWRGDGSAPVTIPVWKIDAVTGEKVWQRDYSCFTENGVSGGVQGTIALGRNKLADLIYVPVARTPQAATGVLAALNKHTGEVVWEKQTQVYSWSSPVAVYDADGNGYIVYCTAGGYMYLFDGLTGQLLDSLNVGGHIEASPAVYNSTIVVGTRGQSIWGVNIT